MSKFAVTSNVARFGVLLEDLSDEIQDEHVPQFMRKTMFDLMKKVIEKNPVDTGRSRAGWSAINEMEGMPDLNIPSAGGGEEKSTFNSDLSGSNPSIEVTNAVEYIMMLEFGWSDQAPEGMVRTSIREMLSGRIGEDLLDTLENVITSANIRASSASGRTLPG